jgi:hypothetical protein
VDRSISSVACRRMTGACFCSTSHRRSHAVSVRIVACRFCSLIDLSVGPRSVAQRRNSGC